MKNKLLEKKFVLVIVFLFTLLPNIKAQVSSKQKSALGVCKSSNINANTAIIQQNIGQSGLVGRKTSKNFDLIQGYLFPNLEAQSPKRTFVPDLNVYRSANENIFVVTPNQNIQIQSWSLFSITGQKLMVQKNNHEPEITINLQSYIHGCYILQVQTNMGNRALKMIR